MKSNVISRSPQDLPRAAWHFQEFSTNPGDSLKSRRLPASSQDIILHKKESDTTCDIQKVPAAHRNRLELPCAPANSQGITFYKKS